MTKDERSRLHKERALLKREKAEAFSLWCDALYRLSLANHVCIFNFKKYVYKNYRYNFSFAIKYFGYLIIWIFVDEYIHVLHI